MTISDVARAQNAIEELREELKGVSGWETRFPIRIEHKLRMIETFVREVMEIPVKIKVG